METVRDIKLADQEAVDAISRTWFYNCCWDIILECGMYKSLSESEWLLILGLSCQLELIHRCFVMEYFNFIAIKNLQATPWRIGQIVLNSLKVFLKTLASNPITYHCFISLLMSRSGELFGHLI